jgi:hypothetical protein
MADRMNWDHPTDRDLIGAIADEIAPSQEQLRSVTTRLNALGYGCTVKAVTYYPFTFLVLLFLIFSVFFTTRSETTFLFMVLTPSFYSQHLQKLRRKEGSAAGEGSSTPAPPKTPKTPKKRATAAKKTPASGKGKRKMATDSSPTGDGDDDDEKSPAKKEETDEDESPAKKMKKEPGSKGKTVKKEETDSKDNLFDGVKKEEDSDSKDVKYATSTCKVDHLATTNSRVYT